jgi:hypothetical protein
MFGHQLNRMIEVARLEKENPSEVFFCLGKRTVCNHDVSILEPQSRAVLHTLERFSAKEMASSSELIVVGEAPVDE